GRGSEAQRRLVEGQEPGFNAMPPQALMHFPRDEAALDEAREAAQLLYRLGMQLGEDSVQAPPLPSALAQWFPALASAYG
ncbi:hypothetical protein, partial [Paraburkholderia sp. BR14427]|uniref:hypothetical protein n=1 Tax=Paraburkholderia sp. BR14427 TaxID=3237008 RepID=UPI0034CF10FA